MSSSGSPGDVYAETLAVFSQREDSSEPLTTPEVADSLDAARRTVYKRLEKLVSRGDLKTKKVGANARVWWRQPAEQPTTDTRDMIERRHAEAERELLYKTTRSIAQSATFDEGLQAALQDICEATDWAYAEAWLPTEEGELRRAEADYHTGDFTEFAEFSEGCTFANGEGLPCRVWASGEFEWAANLPSGLRGEFLRLDEALSVGLNSTLGVPVVADDEVVAVLTFLMREAREIDDPLVKQVSSVAAELGDLLTRRRVEKRLKRERDLVERVLETTPVSVGVLSSDGEIVRANERAAEILAIIEDDPEDDAYVAGERRIYDPDGDPVPPQDRPYAQVFETGEPVLDWQCQIEYPDGERRWLSVNAAALTDEDGEIEWVVTSGEDITQLKEQARRLERQRDDLKTELDEVFDRVSDGFFGLDTHLRFTHVNERAANLLDRSVGELVGEHIWDAFESGAKAKAAFDEALETQKPVTFEEYYEPLDTWFENHVYPSKSGLSVYFRDITKRKYAEEALRESEARLDAFVTATSEVVYRMSPDWSEMYSLEGREFIVDTDEPRETWLEEYIPVNERPRVQEAIGEAIETKSMFDLEHPVVQINGNRGWMHSRAVPILDEDGEIVEWFGTASDITERKRHERELLRYRTTIETVWDGVGVLDGDDRFTMVNQAFCNIAGYDCEELLGEHVTRIHSEAVNEKAEELNEAVIDGSLHVATLEFDLQTADGESIPVEGRFGPYELEDGSIGRAGVIRDISERKRRERNLERYERIVETVRDGVYALDSDDQFVLVNEALCDLVGYDRETLLGAHPTLINSQTVNDTANALQAEIQAGERDVGVVEAEFETATDETVPVEGRIVPFEYADGRVGRCGVVRDVTEQKRREKELTALNRLNQVFQEVTEAIIESSSREEIEQTITDQLTNSDSYEYAWIGHLDRQGEKIAPQIAGTNEADLSEIPLSTATDDPTSHGPVAKALRTGEVQVTYDSTADPVFDQWEWSQDIRHHEGISIPITHEERVYGVLNLYTTRENAFDESERRISERLGEVVGHAINAIERKRALLENRVHEITFRSHRFAEIFTDAAGDESFTLSIEKFVALPDDQSIAYYSLDGLDPAAFIDVIEQYNPDAEYHVTDEEGSRARVEVQQSNLALASELAKYNSWIADGTLQNGEFRLRVQVPKHSHIREVKDAVKEAYPDVEVVAQTEVGRESRRLSDVFSDLDDQLTERQRTALEVAYYSGYFDWPRTITGEELAERLDVTQSTVSHHLRHGEQKLLSAFFGSTA